VTTSRSDDDDGGDDEDDDDDSDDDGDTDVEIIAFDDGRGAVRDVTATLGDGCESPKTTADDVDDAADDVVVVVVVVDDDDDDDSVFDFFVLGKCASASPGAG